MGFQILPPRHGKSCNGVLIRCDFLKCLLITAICISIVGRTLKCTFNKFFILFLFFHLLLHVFLLAVLSASAATAAFEAAISAALLAASASSCAFLEAASSVSLAA